MEDESRCVINIRSANPLDTGEWACHVIYEPQGFVGQGTPPAKMKWVKLLDILLRPGKTEAL